MQNTTSSLTVQQDKIWQNPDLDPSTISILCTLSNNVKSLGDFQQALTAIQSDLNCSITMHGGASSHSIIWLRIKHVSHQIRQRAKEQIDMLTIQPCDQIFLPNPNGSGGLHSRKENEPLAKRFKPKQSAPPEENMMDDSDAFGRKTEIAKNRNLSVTFAPAPGQSLTKSSKLKQISPLSSMSSSSSSSSISSSVFLSPTSSSSSAGLSVNSSFNDSELHGSNKDDPSSSGLWSPAVSSPFGSILSPYNPSLISSRLRFAIQHDEEKYDESRRRNTNSLSEGDQSSSGDSGASDQKTITNRRYPVDVLLMRSDVPSSKKMPDEWFELNQTYPEVCFCGKVLSYFNPSKYHEHWEKTKLRSPDIHVGASNAALLEEQFNSLDLNAKYHSSKSRIESGKARILERRLHKTDDFINVPRADANSNRKYAPFNRQFKFAAAVNSLNEAHSSNEASFRRVRNHDSGASAAASFMTRNEPELASSNPRYTYQQQANSSWSRGARYNAQNLDQRFINR